MVKAEATSLWSYCADKGCETTLCGRDGNISNIYLFKSCDVPMLKLFQTTEPSNAEYRGHSEACVTVPTVHCVSESSSPVTDDWPHDTSVRAAEKIKLLQFCLQLQGAAGHCPSLWTNIGGQKFSKHRPSGPMLSISQNVRLSVRRSVCLSVCLSVHF